jgi:hypothetical protein
MGLVAYATFRKEHSYSQVNNCLQPLWYTGFWEQITGQLNVPWVNDRRLTYSLSFHSYRLCIVKDAPDFSLSYVSLQNMNTRNEQVTVKIGLLTDSMEHIPAWEAPQLPNEFLMVVPSIFAYSGARKPTNAQGCLYYTHQITPTCFGS